MNSLPALYFNDGSRPIEIARLVEPPTEKGIPLVVRWMECFPAEAILSLKSTCKALNIALRLSVCNDMIKSYKFKIFPIFSWSLRSLFNDPNFKMKLASFVPLNREKLIQQVFQTQCEQVLSMWMYPLQQIDILYETAQLFRKVDVDKSLKALEEALAIAETFSSFCIQDLTRMKLSEMALDLDIQKAYEIVKKIQDKKNKIRALLPIAERLIKMSGCRILKDLSKPVLKVSWPKDLFIADFLHYQILEEIAELLNTVNDQALEMQYYDLIVRYIDNSTSQNIQYLNSLIKKIFPYENCPAKETLMMNLSIKIRDIKFATRIIKEIIDPRKKFFAVRELLKQMAKDSPERANKLKADLELLEKNSHLYSDSQDKSKEKQSGNSLEGFIEQFFTIPLKNLVDLYEKNEEIIKDSQPMIFS